MIRKSWPLVFILKLEQQVRVYLHVDRSGAIHWCAPLQTRCLCVMPGSIQVDTTHLLTQIYDLTVGTTSSIYVWYDLFLWPNICRIIAGGVLE